MLNVGSIVIRVDDLESQKEFWGKALDYLPREGNDDDFAPLRPVLCDRCEAAEPPVRTGS